jgi:hypoxanthine-DNA glycosylase
MREIDPFPIFCPPKAKYLILGSFPATDGDEGITHEWYYSKGRNQFWRFLEVIYGVELKNIVSQKALFTKLGMAIGDIVLSCERKNNSSLDAKLTNFEYNLNGIASILDENPIIRILFTSRFTETHYKRHFKDLIKRFPDIELITLPSPSPRYVLMSMEEKLQHYNKVFPSIS